eukprot:TRINITY_DN51298_c0_g1_i1.p1 TRINITY_DN51298_c0_g1~~TRINITY_DN51298_c0_g1_i1.p1  ORF type:complete len:555 (-),score=114.36 TRINITY_DN51298_c0_g1_i1:76-1626(-)
MADKRSQIKEKFQELDKNGDNCLDMAELKALLRKGNPNMSDREIRTLYSAVDKNNDGVVQFDEFVDYLYGAESASGDSGARTAAGRQARLKQSNVATDTGDDSKWDQIIPIFDAFCGADCDGAEFCRLCKDSGLLDRGFTRTDADLIFAKVKPRGQRRMDFEAFKTGIMHAAKKKGISTSSCQDMIINTGGPSHAGATVAENVRFHDDKSLYTGMHKDSSPRGGSPAGDRSMNARREAAAERGRQVDTGDESMWADLVPIFDGFVGKDCDSREFAKICKDCELYDRNFRSTDVDVVFAGVVPRGQRRMGFDLFKLAVGQVAKKKGCTTAEVQQMIKATGGPRFNATKADEVRFHDDKSLYTGMHNDSNRAGSPAGGSRSMDARRSQLAERSGQVDEGDASMWGEVENVFVEFGDDKGIENREFSKLCADCGLYDGNYTMRDADIVFVHVVPRGKRNMTFEQFKRAVGEIAKKRGMSTTDVQRAICQTDGPKWNATEAESVRFHDDKDLYTGMHFGK